MMQFQKAERHKAKLRLAITGPSGSGKTWGALQVARGLGGKVAVIDTERGSASLYAHLLDFDVLELAPPYAPERFIEAIKAAEGAGYEVLIIDSATHEWNGVGGCLELVDQLAGSKYRGNTWSAWSDVTPRHRAFIDAMLRSSVHVIVTMRTKTETAQTTENGKTKVVKLGMKSEQRDGIEYEFTTVLDLSHDGHFAVASKDRTGLFTGDPKKLSETAGAALLAWLESGAEVLSQESGPPPPTPTGRKSSAQAKRDGDDVRVKAEIAALDKDGLADWLAHFDEYTADQPRGWLDPIRDMLEHRREELFEPPIADAEAMDDAFRQTMGGGRTESVPRRAGHVEAA